VYNKQKQGSLLMQMKSLFLLFTLLSSLLIAEDNSTIDVSKSLKEGSYKIVPLVSSNPTSGTGVGAAVTYLYTLDPNSSPSQILSGAQYTDTKSWSAFIKNDAYLYSDKLRSTTVLSLVHNKSQFDIPSDADFDIGSSDALPDAGEGVMYNIDILFIAQMLSYEVKNHLFAGGHIYYLTQTFSDANEPGKIFLEENGASDAQRATVGLDFSYDTRNKKEKYFPRNAEWILLQANYSPTFLGADDSFSSLVINARVYRPGFNKEDVWANQLYGFYSSENTPDGSLAALGSRKILRGFPIGKYKARFLTAFQTEYRYQITNTKYRVVAFAGVADLQGGSIGDGEGNNRDEDNGIYYSGGAGLRYAIQKKAGVDLHLDVATSNDGEISVYVGVNQAF